MLNRKITKLNLNYKKRLTVNNGKGGNTVSSQ